MTPETLPAGLEFHCQRCRLVIPADAPRPDAGAAAPVDVELHCESIARHKLAWFAPKASPALQHIMASAAWELIYHFHLRPRDPEAAPHAESVAYLLQFKREPERHWKSFQTYRQTVDADSGSGLLTQHSTRATRLPRR